ncbi:hypothetical protein CA13_06010 [Planctomycetes bacterium CA13]|uniref:Uncharacterized protein n=1 Tax=Novipirellula herctigrandis TaxID=2527986 RepID=A0A5C5YXC5_9BACT|nr:hypothetical protein CA13_06010 [Planctomycetes bacterium CA13]
MVGTLWCVRQRYKAPLATGHAADSLKDNIYASDFPHTYSPRDLSAWRNYFRTRLSRP